MTKTSGSRRISSAMASRSASRMVMETSSVPSGTSGSGMISADGGLAVPVFAGAGASACLAACGSCAGGADSAAFSWRDGCSALLCLVGACLPSLSAAASSPSARIIAIGVLTATSAVPSGTRILPSVPSSTASTSMVALSVSISAITSPDLTGSPSFLSHLARLPRSIVGDNAGINISVGMNSLSPGGNGAAASGSSAARCSAVDVGVELGGVGLGVVGGELRCLVDDRAHLGVNLLECVLARPLLRYQPLAHLLDRIVLAANLVDLLLGAVLGRIRHRMAAIAV